jgi:hypothetical protein
MKRLAELEVEYRLNPARLSDELRKKLEYGRKLPR